MTVAIRLERLGPTSFVMVGEGRLRRRASAAVNKRVATRFCQRTPAHRMVPP
jgi:hypothetical protein